MGKLSASLKLAIGSPCPYCLTVMRTKKGRHRNPTRDHQFPRSRFAAASVQDGQRNVRIVCSRCNIDKGDRTLAEWFAVLRQRGDIRADRVADCLTTLGEIRMIERKGEDHVASPE